EANNAVPGLLTVDPSMDVRDSIICSVNGKSISNNLAITYLYGKWKYVGYEWKNNGKKEALAASILLIILCSFAIIYLISHAKKIDLRGVAKSWGSCDNLKQTLYIFWFFVFFIGAAAISKIRDNEHAPLGVYVYVAFVVGITGFYLYLKRRGGYKKKENTLYRLLQDKGLLTVLLFSTLVRVPLFLHIQLWDGLIYYGELQRVCSNFEYTLSYIWENFRLCGHYSIIYTFFASIGEFLFPNNMTGVLMVMLVLTDAALVCIYKMLRGYWLNLSQVEAAIGTMLVSVCPLFLGLFSNVSLEHLLFVFTVFLFYAEYRKQTIMKVVWLVSIMMTKETGLVIVGGYLLAHILAHLWDTIKYKGRDKLQYFLFDFHVLCAAGGMVLVCLYTIRQNGLFVWFGMNQRTGGNLITEYLENLPGKMPFIMHKIKILFVLHFEWIPVLIIVLCIIFRILKRQKMSIFHGKLSFMGALGIFVLLNFYLIGYTLGRYHIFSAVMIWLLAYIILLKTFRNFLKNKIGFGSTVAVIALLVIQNFYYIDPLTNLMFDCFDTGKGKMVSTEIGGGNLGDAFANNFRHTYLYGLIDAMLEESEYDEETQIVIPTERDYLYFHAYTGYNKDEKRRVFDVLPDEENVIRISCVCLPDVLSLEQDKMPERGVMYFLPFIKCDEREVVAQVERFYKVSERREISNWGGTLSYYILERKM
ncbi:MAG: hypothetical protein PUC12_10870, partial [Clostridiales bacterium]|nr:hypothetical protein [Clostridiales bacterium]